MGDWNFNDLTQASKGVPSLFGGPLAGYVWENQNTQHVIYIGDTDNHIHELYYNGRWWSNDLTKVANGVTPGLTNIVAYAFEHQNTEHVFYADKDGHIHELWYDSTWHHNDLLTSITGNPPAWAAGKIAAYVWENNGTEHVAYCGTDGHVHELYFDGKWHHSDLTKVSGGPSNVSSNLTGFAWENKNSEHIFYSGPDGHIHELWYDIAHPTWHDSDLNTNPAGAPIPMTDNFVGYVWEGDNSEHLIYSPTVGAIQELWHNGKWSTSDIWARSSGASFPRSGGELAGYAWEKQNSEHVVYVDGNGHVCELYFLAPSPPPPPPVPPIISVTCKDGIYTITGSKFLSGATVYIRVVDMYSVSYHGPPYFQQSADGHGNLNAQIRNSSLSYNNTGPSPAAGTPLYFSANDGRQNQQNTDALWSNIFKIPAC